MNRDSAAAQHLAELDATHEAHLQALRERAERARASLDARISGLEGPLPPGDAPPPPQDLP